MSAYIDAADGLDRARHLIEAARMAASTLTRDEAEALMIVLEKTDGELEGVAGFLEALRGSPPAA